MSEDLAGGGSIAARIAALNLNQVGRNPTSAPSPSANSSSNTSGRRAPPPLPSRANKSSNNNDDLSLRPPLPSRPGSRTPSVASNTYDRDDASPRLPPRRPSAASSVRTSVDDEGPSLPPRRQSSNLAPTTSNGSVYSPKLGRRGSQESVASTFSRASAPVLPTRRKDSRHDDGNGYATPPLPTRPRADAPSLPQRPGRRQSDDEEKAPVLPTRPSRGDDEGIRGRGNNHSRPNRSRSRSNHRPVLPSRPNQFNGNAPRLPTRPTNGDVTPPPVPAATKPKPRAAANNTQAEDTNGCLFCRDFSGPDEHATKFPRSSLTNYDPNWLGKQLGAPFPMHVDKARAIFAWLHHNIAYDVNAFFSKNIRGTTPRDTLRGGLAVCDGYSGLWNALCEGAGVEAIRVTGHGKGNSKPPSSPINITNFISRYRIRFRIRENPSQKCDWPRMERIPPRLRRLETRRFLLGSWKR
jgi:hypothetical protein